MLTRERARLENTFGKIARIIGSQFGIRVRIQGRGAYVSFRKNLINLPSCTDEEQQRLRPFLDGFLDHEIAHLLYTDQEVFERLVGDIEKDVEGAQVRKDIWNIVEDCWIERMIASVYPGCGSHIEDLNHEIHTLEDEEWSEYTTLPRLLGALARTMRGYTKLSDYAGDDKIGELIEEFGPEVDESKTIDNTTDALALADRVIERLKQMVDLPPNDPKQEQALMALAPGQTGKMDGEALVAAIIGDPGDTGDDGDGDEDDDADDDSRASGKAYATWDQRRFKRRYSGNNEPEEYLVFSDEFDYDHVYSAEERNEVTNRYNDLKDQVRPFIGAMASKLELSLAALSERRWQRAQPRGRRFDRKRLVRFVSRTSDDRRFWQKRADSEWIDTAVTLLWDCSGSMGSSGFFQRGAYEDYTGNKAALARIAAVAFHEALKSADVPHEVLGFNTAGEVPEALFAAVQRARDEGDDLSRYSRTDDVDKRMVFKSFDDDDGRAIAHITGQACNRDGECVLWAAKRLADRPEQRKVLIVGSDGQPSGATYGFLEEKYLADVVQKILGAGIEVIGIGIMDESVKDYYPNYVVLNQADELPGVLMARLSEALTGANKGATKNARTGVSAT